MNIILYDQVWLAANAPGFDPATSLISSTYASFTYYLPDNKARTVANISIARHTAPSVEYWPGITGGYDLGGGLEAYIRSWGEAGPGGTNVHLFDYMGEPSALDTENCVEVTFVLHAYNRSGIATATIMQFA
jgi:hypothetical protein